MYATSVLKNGIVYTADAAERIYQAVAINGAEIMFAGSDQAVEQYIGPATHVIDLAGNLVIPGMIDSHIHPPGLSLLELYEVKLFDRNTLADYLVAVREFLDQHPQAELVYGRGWSWAVLEDEEHNKGPRKEYLDAISTDIPIVLRANDGHTLWVNSKALAVNGITADTEVPHGGVIERDPVSGELWGTLKEAAMRLVALPEYSIEQYAAAMSAFQQKMHRYGITGILALGSMTIQSIFAACESMRREGKLRLRIRGAVSIQPGEEIGPQLQAIEGLRARFNYPDLQVTTAKFFTDGVVEGGTSHLIRPYTFACGKGENHFGDFLWDLDALKQAFALANQAGLQIHVHSTGDASTKKVLDAFAFAKTLAPGDHRNTITHLQLVAEDDMQRFKDLQVIASVQPYWQFKGPKWWRQVDYTLLGERAQRQFPLGSFFANGITVGSSSDYPATVDAYPLRAIEIGVTRNLDNGPLFGVEDITDIDDERYLLNKQERATVRQMINSFTINNAYMLFMENKTGSIEPGKLADLVVLDQNILAVNPLDIGDTQVVMTIFGGDVVYERGTE